MDNNENMEIEEPKEWEEPDDLIEEELEIGGYRKESVTEAFKGFLTGLLFKSILLALILHVILIGLTSLRMFMNKPAPAEGQDNEKKTESEETGEKEAKPAPDITEETEKTGENEHKTEEASSDETSTKEESQDKTKPTGNAEDYIKKMETVSPDKAPDNPLETSGDEL